MHHKRPNKNNLNVYIFMACISTSLQIHPFYFCCNNKKIHNEVLDPSLKNDDIKNDSITVSKSLTQDDYSEYAPRKKPIQNKNVRHVVRRPQMMGMVAIGIPRYLDEHDSISE